jgi:hypothetical protein
MPRACRAPRRRHAARLALLAAAARGAAAWFRDAAPAALSATTFAALSDWGGIGTPPYTTPSQLAVASALNTVAAAEDISFVLSAGNNFRPAGLPGARRQRGPRQRAARRGLRRGAAPHSTRFCFCARRVRGAHAPPAPLARAGSRAGFNTRFNASFQDVYTGAALQARARWSAGPPMPPIPRPRSASSRAGAARAPRTAPRRTVPPRPGARRSPCAPDGPLRRLARVCHPRALACASALAHSQPRRRCPGTSRVATWTGWATPRASGR